MSNNLARRVRWNLKYEDISYNNYGCDCDLLTNTYTNSFGMKIIASKKKCDSCCATVFYDIVHPGSALDLCGAQSLFYDMKYLICTALISVISHNKIDIDCDPDRDLAHYGVVYAYMYVSDVAWLLLYNIQGLNPDDDNYNNMNRYHDTVRNNNEPTTSQTNDNVVNYVINEIV